MALRRKGVRGQRGHELFPGFTDIVEIGIGSLAVVFRARELATNRQVALKLLNVRDASPRSIESFERESIALGALSSHPNIVTLYRTFRIHDGRPVLVLELCTGAVAERIHVSGGVPVTDAVAIGIKIAGALETAHRAGILHRDVKPQNILVTDFGEPALADFGVAMLQSATQTTAGLFDFTTLHAAPELLEGGGTSAATDVYELASSLYQLIAGQSAFRAYEGESPASVILRILRDPVRPLSGVDVPVALSDLLIRAMSKQMDERPPTAAEFAAELADVEIAQGWTRTQFLIRDPGPLGIGVAPSITRMPDAVPRGLPSTLAPSHALRPDVVEELQAQLQVEPVRRPTRAPEPEPVRAPSDWSTPTIVPSAGWTPPPAGEPRTPVALPPQPDGWWSAPPPSAQHGTLAPPARDVPGPPTPAPTWQPATAPVEAAASEQPVAPPAVEPPPAEPPEAEPEIAARREPTRPAPTHPDAPPRQQQPADWAGFAAPAFPAPTPEPTEPTPEATPEATPEPAPRRRREAVEIDDDFFPARRPPGVPAPPPPAAAQRDPSPVAQAHPVASRPGDSDAVPVWAVRAPTPMQPADGSGPQFSSDLSLDPMSLRRKATIRSGASSVQVDEQHLRLRTWWRRSTIRWSDVHGFEAHYDTFDDGPSSAAYLVAMTAGGPVELPGTKRSVAELRYVHVLLDAYRIRAQRLANR